MHELGIHSRTDMKKWKESDLGKYFGKVWCFYYVLYYSIARTVKERAVNPNQHLPTIGSEKTFDHTKALKLI